MDVKLKPCPFCGGKARIYVDRENAEAQLAHIWYIVCDDCCATTGLAISKEKAAEAWNRRSDFER